ncbi:ATP-binding cassette domain-containing protein [Pseudogracilibacillus auburnensis]|uniref:ATP-binding cassette domain-containing protein n=1 Tax=Pseudogracilibacillus auburnensis TaxID=1494959 RepID=UPI001A9779B9|nr:ABC transporter ATP-binding protein [Pseudogracilibacillus auburnensis]MBO1004543.1 ABC transporter ATP-binding protein [Pseudogracilibacillus auburnensis]
MISLHIDRMSYNNTFKLEKIDLDIKKNEITLLLGHNGAGKTTIIKSLFGLVEFKGNLKLNNRVISLKKSQDLDLFKRETSYISDELSLFDYLTPSEYFSLMKNTVTEKVDDKFLNLLIELFELEVYLDNPISTLSHGNKKKTQIVSQLLKKPNYIIFDEPTNGLDPDMIIVLKKVLQIIKKMNIGILLSTHNLSFGEELYDQIMVLRDGKIKLNASKEQVKAQYSNHTLEEIYTKVNKDYYTHIEGILHELNQAND